MGLPEQELVVSSTVREVRDDGVAIIDTEARQGDTRVVRRGRGRGARRRLLDIAGVLTPRQELLLAKVIDGFSATGKPVGSKALAADPDITAGSSTIRNELAVLEERGLLAHPHTSAGRVPTDARLPLLRRPAAARAARGRPSTGGSSSRSPAARSTRRCG